MKRQPRQLPLYLSAPHPCSYLDDQQSSTLFADPNGPMDMRTYSELLQFGFRRSGRLVYAPRCEFCRQCISVRVPVADFAPTRSQRRVSAANRDITLKARRPEFDPEHFALYQRYTRARHRDGDMADATPEEYMGFLNAEWSDTRFVELLSEDRLVGVAVTDIAIDGLSAVYTFFDPDLSRRSLGTFAILRQIDMARTLNLDFLYLGYWIADSPKMAYKIRFSPIERWVDGRWRRTTSEDIR